LVRKIFFAGEEAQEGAALLCNVVADCALQHGISRLKRVQHGALRDRSFDFEFNFVADVSERTKVVRQFNSNV
jgi:hypothetical protein